MPHVRALAAPSGLSRPGPVAVGLPWQEPDSEWGGSGSGRVDLATSIDTEGRRTVTRSDFDAAYGDWDSVREDAERIAASNSFVPPKLAGRGVGRAARGRALARGSDGRSGARADDLRRARARRPDLPRGRHPARHGRRRRHLRREPEHQLHQRLLHRVPVLRVRPAPHGRRRVHALARPGRRPRGGGLGCRGDRGLHARRHPPRPAGHRLLRPRRRGEAPRPRHARARVQPDGGRERRDPHRPEHRGVVDRREGGRARHDSRHGRGDPGRRRPLGSDEGEAADGRLDRGGDDRSLRGAALVLDDDVRPRRQPGPLGRASQAAGAAAGHPAAGSPSSSRCRSSTTARRSTSPASRARARPRGTTSPCTRWPGCCCTGGSTTSRPRG